MIKFVIAVILGFIIANIMWVFVLSPDEPATQSQPLTIAMSTTPLSAPLIIAEEQKLFEKHGLNISLIPTRGGKLCFNMMINGEADLATSSESVVMFNGFQRSDFSLLTSFVVSDNDVKLITLAESNINQPIDLKNKTIGVTKGSASEFFVYAYMILTGNAALPIKLKHYKPELLGPALLSKQVDAISTWEPEGYYLTSKQANKTHTFNSKGVYSLSFNLVGKRANMTKHLTSHTLLLKALDDAMAFIIQYPNESQRIVANYLQLSGELLSASWQDYVFRLSLGNALISNLQTQAHWAIESGLVESHTIPDYRALFDTRALDSIVPPHQALNR